MLLPVTLLIPPFAPPFGLLTDLYCSALFDAFCRSPWSNAYDPALPDGALPSAKLRELEVSANEAFDIYRELYVPANTFLHTLSPFLTVSFF